MTVTQTVRDWLYVGAPVIIVTIGWTGSPDRAKRATVTKIGKRDVVLDDGDRFNVHTLTQSTGEGSWRRTAAEIVAPHNPHGLRTLAEGMTRVSSKAAETALGKWRATLDPADAQAAIDAITRGMNHVATMLGETT